MVKYNENIKYARERLKYIRCKLKYYRDNFTLTRDKFKYTREKKKHTRGIATICYWVIGQNNGLEGWGLKRRPPAGGEGPFNM